MNLLANTEADLMVVDTFAELNSELQENGLRFRVANVSWSVRDLLKRLGIKRYIVESTNHYLFLKFYRIAQ